MVVVLTSSQTIKTLYTDQEEKERNIRREVVRTSIFLVWVTVPGCNYTGRVPYIIVVGRDEKPKSLGVWRDDPSDGPKMNDGPSFYYRL